MNIRVKEEALQAMKENRPVVALESTIISHGMPYPQNVETAMETERIIREHGAVPCTIGIIDGVGVVGMSPEEIEEFGKREGIAKVSRRDLPIIMAEKQWGATTVATTMILAEKAGIEVFVTGGIGGVHRGAQETWDVSADLNELENTNVTVVCAGAKAILDLPLTLEELETRGVPVLGYQTKELPAFFTRKSGLSVDYALKDANDAAKIIAEKRDLGLDGGVLVANPIPEEYSMDADVINKAIEDAVKEAAETGIHGKETTPFLLSKIKDITEGKSLESNIQLVFNNAKVGAEIAKELCGLKK